MDYYSVLEVRPGASNEEIRESFKRLIKQWHPDVCKHPDAEKRTKQIVEAWSVLSDPEQRRLYDKARAAAHSLRQTTWTESEQAKWQKYQQQARRAGEAAARISLSSILDEAVQTVVDLIRIADRVLGDYVVPALSPDSIRESAGVLVEAVDDVFTAGVRCILKVLGRD